VGDRASSEPIDLFDLYRALADAGSGGRRDPAGWLAELRTARREALAVYRGRVTEVAATIDATATELEAVPSCS
jgi:hypothetical protein